MHPNNIHTTLTTALIKKLFLHTCSITTIKVENILKGSQDSIPSPSPSMKIQIMGEKVC